MFAATASPADVEPGSLDKRQLAAAFYTLVTGPSSDASLEDLLGRDAPRPFAVGDEKGVPALTLLGPAVVRFALKLPPSAELRFTPELLPAARAAAGAASFRVTRGERRRGRARGLGARDRRAREGPGRAGRAAPREGRRHRPDRPRGGRRGQPALRLGPLRRAAGPRARAGATRCSRPRSPPADDARADALRKALAGANVLLVILDAGRAQSFGAYGYARPTTPEIDRIASEGVVFERVYTPAGLHAGRDVVGLDLAVPRPPPQRGLVLGHACRRTA